MRFGCSGTDIADRIAHRVGRATNDFTRRAGHIGDNARNAREWSGGFEMDGEKERGERGADAEQERHTANNCPSATLVVRPGVLIRVYHSDTLPHLSHAPIAMHNAYTAISTEANGPFNCTRVSQRLCDMRTICGHYHMEDDNPSTTQRCTYDLCKSDAIVALLPSDERP